jgi:hypothetical protein
MYNPWKWVQDRRGKVGEEYMHHKYFYYGKGKMVWWLMKNGVKFVLHHLYNICMVRGMI